MRLKEIGINKLFRLFDYRIPLNMNDRITIIHGPNGYGKTAILRLTAGLLDGRYSALRQLPFESLSLTFDDESILTVTREDSIQHNGNRARRPVLTLQYPPHRSFRIPESVSADRQLPFPLSAIDSMIPELERVGPQQWVVLSTDEILDLEELLLRYSDTLPIEPGTWSKTPEWLMELRASIPVHLIQANRLERLDDSVPPRWPLSERRFRPVTAVAKYSAELASRIQQTLAQYAALSQSLDRSFPQRLVGAPGQPQLERTLINQRLSELENKRTRLTEAGLLDKEEKSHFDLPSSFDESKIDVLSVYIADAEKKLAVFDDLFRRISLFKSIITPRFAYKSIAMNKDDGFVFETRDGQVLAPTGLSTGEQHEIVLLYELLFKVEPNSLILIDEPEISLHVAWQEQFLSDIEQITEISRFDVLIATHSPQIISNRWDLTVKLKGPK